LITYLLSFIAIIQYEAFGTYNMTFEFVAFSVFIPSAGTFNWFVFARTRQMKTPEGRISRAVLFCTCCRTAVSALASRISDFSSVIRASTELPNTTRDSTTEFKAHPGISHHDTRECSSAVHDEGIDKDVCIDSTDSNQQQPSHDAAMDLDLSVR
jgi:hypothetical protein